MPLFDYACPVCLFLQEDVLEKVSDPDIKECPICHKKTLARLQPINHFQISGFSYQNGYSKSGSNKN
jgi:putative FmdB family regulatory protein